MNRRTFLKAAAGLATIATACKKSSPVKGRILGASAHTGHLLRQNTFGPPREVIKKDAVIIGGGISGLSAARQLHRKGIANFALLELEGTMGGNSSSGKNAISSFPWGAHYVPTPNNDLTEYLEFLEACGVVTGRDAQGLPVYNEYMLCFDPQERLYLNGRWQEGLVPRFGVSPEEVEQTDRFFTLMEGFRHQKGSDGKEAFALPVARSSTDPAFTRLDDITLQQWLRQNGFTSPYLHGYLDYCTRDDFGTPVHQVSAWAGIHYFAARKGRGANAGPGDVLTWPEGNGWLAAQLQKDTGKQLHPHCLAVRLEEIGGGVRVTCLDTQRHHLFAFEAPHCIAAVPQFVVARLLADEVRAAKVREHFSYVPWMVANLYVSGLEERSGAPPAWDNVVFGSPSLGYVDATHNLPRQAGKDRNLTYYLPLTAGTPAREREAALRRSHAEWADMIFIDLEKIHPGIRRSTRELNVMLWGHAMTQPLPGSIWGRARNELSRSLFNNRLHFAHTDIAGMSLFEEAFYGGIAAAERVSL